MSLRHDFDKECVEHPVWERKTFPYKAMKSNHSRCTVKEFLLEKQCSLTEGIAQD